MGNIDHTVQQPVHPQLHFPLLLSRKPYHPIRHTVLTPAVFCCIIVTIDITPALVLLYIGVTCSASYFALCAHLPVVAIRRRTSPLFLRPAYTENKTGLNTHIYIRNKDTVTTGQFSCATCPTQKCRKYGASRYGITLIH